MSEACSSEPMVVYNAHPWLSDEWYMLVGASGCI